MNNRRQRGNDVDRIVAQIDETRVTELWRNPDRPDGRFVRSRSRQDPQITRAKTRARTALYRVRLDQRHAPSTAQIAMAMVVALVTADLDELTEADRGIVRRALVSLKGHGFCVVEAKNMLRKLRNRILDPGDRAGEQSTSDPIETSALENASPVF
jgi:hypothetical protein